MPVETVVLFSILSFLKEVDKIFRNYIWGSNEEKRKVPFAGLNVKGCNNWNIVASIDKLLWQLSEKMGKMGPCFCPFKKKTTTLGFQI
ncbi:hypothetical protein H5410_026133 [Solanum commersonii]|uniref:Uncharacterized protein n=1 Tax=Solanum commersonii TaxID=4109 RepID=A0A9J5YVP5_SOLCO|nr:hypothetical protein H5410_026133 [Solanum commersonii]